jgi:amino acid adenylation domain-containing protein
VECFPERVALTGDRGAWTYAELDEQANRIAHLLARHGVGRETPVALVFERSPELVAAILGIVKAGATYVPVDPGYPDDRVAFMLTDAQAPVVLTRRALAGRLPDGSARVLCLDDPALALDELPALPPPCDGSPEDTAYIIYTSGSTGRPKGCCVTHRNVIRLFTATRPWFGFDERDVWTLFHSAAFDFSVWEMWGALLHGGRLVVVPYLTSRAPDEFLQLLVRERVTVLNQTPSAFRQLSAVEAALAEPQPLALRHVIFGGEALEMRALQPWFDRHGDECPRLVNMYGITETTVHVTYRPLTARDVGRGSLIGVPIPDLRLHVLDAEMRECPVGQPGEIFVGGAGVARGYLNRPELTAERFLPSPFAAGDRLYRSGDLARRLPDGELEYLGRIDQQVKVRGFRVELGEIESVLQAHPAIREAVVLARDGAGEQELAAYLVLSGEAPSPAALRDFLGRSLPAYMVPAAYFEVPRIPLTPNGKTDRAALAQGERNRELRSHTERIAPRGALEEQLAQIWQDVLRREQVGAEDDFFQLGGHSLLAMQVSGRAGSLLRRMVPVTLLFQHSNLADYATAIAALTTERPAEDISPETLPLTPLQQGMLVHHLLTPGTGVDIGQLVCTLEGELDAMALEQAWTDVVARHAALRASFRWEGLASPVQVIAPARPAPWAAADWRDTDAGEQEPRFAAWLHTDRQRGFNLAEWPLFRVQLLRLGETAHRLVWTLHHALLDDRGIERVVREVFAIHDARGRGERAGLPAAAPLAGYLTWVTGRDAAASESFWREQLRGFTRPTPLAIDHAPAPRVDHARQADREIRLAEDQHQALRALAAEHGLSFKTLIHGVWAILLSRYSGEPEVLFGVIHSGREDAPAGTKDVVGNCWNTVPLRVAVDEDAEAAGWLRQLEARWNSIRPHALTSLALIQEWSEVPAGQPLFASLVDVEDFQLQEELGAPGRQFRFFGQTNYPLTLAVYPARELFLKLEFDLARFDDATIERLLGHLRSLLEGLAGHPAGRIAELPLLAAAELRQLRTGWEASHRDFPRGECLHRLVEAQVERTPDAIAVVEGDTELTYRELNRRANQLARQLAACGVGPDVLVAVYAGRSAAVVAGLLAVLKAGGAYVPIDPSYPAERVALMLEESRAPVVLTQRDLMGSLPPGPAATILCVDDALQTPPAGDAGNLPGPAGDEHLAYVLYTSGSTGRPKGAMISHRAIVNHTRWMQEAFPLTAADSVVQKTPFSFDASVWEFWSPLAAGARLILAPPGAHRDPEALVDCLHRQQVTILQVVPTLLALLLDQPGFKSCHRLRRVFCGGEALAAPLAARLHAALEVELCNLYGPTEVTIDALFCVVPRDLAGPVLLGRPVANTRACVLDARLRPLPVGVPGELFLGGSQVARGYWQRPGLTAEKFVPSPLPEPADGTLYRTGDRVRQLADGQFEFLGRLDEQIKLRGQRIELGEIEAALATCPGVGSCAVALREDKPGEVRLVGYLVPVAVDPPSPAELRAALRQRLPDFMVPSAFVTLKQLPWLPNGKLDRRALPAPEPARPAAEAAASAVPRTPTEAAMAALWCEVLGVGHAGPDDSFTDLGGHSLAAMRVVGRARQLHDWRISLPVLFQHPTLAGLAAVVDAMQGVTLRATARSSRAAEVFPLSPMQQALFFSSLRHPGSGAELLQLTWRVDPRSDPRQLLEAARQLAVKDDLLRAAFHPVGPEQPAQEIRSEVEVELATHDFSSLSVAEREAAWRELLAADRRRGFDLHRPPLWRLKLVRTSDTEARLLFTIHHAITDGRSLILLLRDLGEAFAALAAGQVPEIPDRRPFKDFIDWLEQQELSPAEAFWRAAMAGATPQAPLQVGPPPDEPPGIRAHRESVPAPVDEPLARRLRELAARLDVTLNTLVQGSWALALGHGTGAPEVIFGTTRAARKSALAEGPEMTGIFINTLPVRAPIAGADRLAPWLAGLRAQQLAARPHEHTPLPRLQEWCSGGRPLFESLVMFEGADFARQLRKAGADWAAEDFTLDQMPGPALTLVAYDGDGLEARVHYDPLRFTHTAVNDLARHWGAVLAAMAEQPDATLGEIQALAAGRKTGSGMPSSSAPVLSAEEQRMWFLDHALPDRTAYNVPLVVRLHGPLDLPRLERALRAVVSRHEILRTRYIGHEGVPRREILQPPPALLELVDLTGTPEPRREETTRARTAALLATTFELATAPPWRMTCLRFAPEEHVLALVAHHIICDEWSLRIWFHELEAHYAAGGDARLPALPLQYADYARRQAERLRQPEMDAHRDYWRGQLEGVEGWLELPCDHPRPTSPTQRGAFATLPLPSAATRQIEALARSQGATWFMAVTALWQTLLHRWSGREDVVVAVPVAQRDHAEVDALIGMFLNTLPLRARIEPRMSFLELLDQTRATVLAAVEHGSLPFDDIVRQGTGHPAGRSPLAQVMLAPMTDLPRALELTGQKSEVLGFQPTTAKCDLTLFVSPRAGGDWEAGLEYSLDLFTPTTAARLLEQFRQLLESAAADPDQAVSHLNLLSESDRRQLREWNDTAREFPRGDALLHELCSEQSSRTPDATAVVFEHQPLTFGELEARSNQLAHYLRSLGIGQGALVGVGLERSPDLLVALLATLKAGAAYLPLDPGYPAERLRFMLLDSGATVLLTDERLVSGWPDTGARLVALEQAWKEISRWPAEPPVLALNTEDPAYVIYTSGSTGQPKGAVVPHRAIVNHMLWLQERFPVTIDDAVLQKTPFCFDASVWELFLPLLTGAKLILARPDGHRDPGHLVSLVKEQQVTTIQFVPSLLELFLDHPDVGECGSLRRVFCGGEALSPALCKRVFATLAVELINLYGPTETAIDTSFWVCTRDDERPFTPIGRPVANTRFHILDARLQPLPPGVAGELCIGGAQVGLGYWRRPELTAEKFLHDPHGDSPDSRLYRTGDRCRWLEDGTVEFLGRLDAQVKVRGLRIELGEIESALSEHPDLASVAVLARGESLVACFTAIPGTKVDAKDLRHFLRDRLPEPLVPSEFVRLETMPLMPNGKIDRRALSMAASFPRLSDLTREAPRNPREKVIAAVWRDVLGGAEPGIHDDFFALGGHSLLAMRVAARLTRALGTEVPLRLILESPTVAGLAAALEPAGLAPASAAIHPVPRGGPLPLSREQERLWFLQQVLAEPSAYNVASAIRLRGPLDLGRLERAWQQLTARHEILRMRFIEVGGTVRQIPAELSGPRVGVADLRALPDAEREARVAAGLAEEARTPFDLAVAPLFRVKCLRLTDTEHVLAVTFHHLLCDEWSTAILFDELATLYRDTDRVLAALPLQYADYAAWQHGQLGRDAFAVQRDYWRGQLADAPDALELPTDHARPPRPSGRGGQAGFRVGPEPAKALGRLAREEGATPFMAWLAVFAAFLHRLGAQSDLLVGTPFAQRRQPEVQGLPGFFLNTLPIRSRTGPDTGFRELLRATRATVLAAFDHGELPFDEITRLAAESRTTGAPALIQSLFVMLEGPPARFHLPGLSAEPIAIPAETAKFDLSLFLHGSDGGGLDGLLEFSADLFTPASAERFAAQFCQLAGAIAAEPEAPLDTLELLPPDQRRQLLETFNATRAEFTLPGGVHEWFEARARQSPGAEAVRFGETRLSYGELNERASGLARHLRDQGVRPDSRVGICLERSPDLVIAVLATLKAGGACLPLDPEYPAERLRFMLEDARPAVVLTQTALAERLPAHAAECVLMDARLPEHPSGDALPAEADRGRLAYVLFTSGSTGRPKGVALPHLALLNLIAWQSDASACGPGDRTLQFASLNFDVSFQEIFATLSTGGSLVLVPEATRRDLSALARVIREQRVTRIFMPFVVLDDLARLLVEVGTDGLALQEVVTAGEQLRVTPALVALFERLPGAVLVNQYGPTETHVVTAYALTGRPDHWPLLPPIGRPVANTRILVLDERRQPVPIGVPGELCVAGAQVARGYLERPELTAEKFIQHPEFGRLYRTGDRCRWRADGHLEYLGRGDDQVKVRGFRVELGEVETVLTMQPGVQQAAVVAVDGTGGITGLAAFLVMREGVVWDDPQARARLREHLPEYMVPARFIAVDRLPLSPNGKVDRRALARRAEQETAPLRREPLAPRNETEAVLVAIWEDVLGRRPVGVADDFFDLGGHSLLALRLTRAIEERFGLRLPLAGLFAAPTVEALARLLDGPAPSDARGPAGRLRGQGNGAPLFHIPGIGGFEFLPPAVAARVGAIRRFYDGLEYPGLDGQAEPLTRVEDLAAHLIGQIEEIAPDGPCCLSGYSFGGVVAYEIARQLTARGRVVEAVLLWDSFAPAAFSKRSTFAALRVLRRHLGGLAPRERVGFLGRQALKKIRFLGNRATKRIPSLNADYPSTTTNGGNPGATNARERLTQAALDAYRDYQPAPYAGRLVVFQVEERESGVGFRYAPDDFNGWRELAWDGVEIVRVPGTHHTVLEEPAVSVLAARLAERLGSTRDLGS